MTRVPPGDRKEPHLTVLQRPLSVLGLLRRLPAGTRMRGTSRLDVPIVRPCSRMSLRPPQMAKTRYGSKEAGCRT
jgi:hypothetical protein